MKALYKNTLRSRNLNPLKFLTLSVFGLALILSCKQVPQNERSDQTRPENLLNQPSNDYPQKNVTETIQMKISHEIDELRSDLRQFKLSAKLDQKEPNDEFIGKIIDAALEKSDDDIEKIILSQEYSDIQSQASEVFNPVNSSQAPTQAQDGANKPPTTQPTDSSGGMLEKELINPLSAVFGGQYNDYNGSLLLLSLGLVGMTNGLIEASLGQRAHGAVTAGIGLAMLVAAEKLSRGNPTTETQATSGVLIMSHALFSLTGAAIFLTKSRTFMSKMSASQKLTFAKWMNRAGIIKPPPGKAVDFLADGWDLKKMDPFGKMTPQQLQQAVDNKIIAHFEADGTQIADSKTLKTIDVGGKLVGAALGTYAVIGAGLEIKRLFDSYSALKMIKKIENQELRLAESQKMDQAGQDLIESLNYRAKRLQMLKALLDH